MERKIFEILYKTEEKYWWFIGQRFLVNNFLRKYYNTGSDLNLLDVGCGTGINLELLGKFGTPYGIDYSNDAISFCKLRGVKNVKKSNVMEIKFPDKKFDVVTVFGVFYHKGVTDDIKAMKEIYRVLEPGGRFLIFDCAMECLFGKHDVAFDGIRRYSKKELRSKLEKAGFKMEKISYVNTLLFPAVYLSRKFGNLLNLKPKSEVQDTFNPVINSLLKVLFKTELRLINHMNLPYGINIFAVAKKE